jgi:hypothetical protein
MSKAKRIEQGKKENKYPNFDCKACCEVGLYPPELTSDGSYTHAGENWEHNTKDCPYDVLKRWICKTCLVFGH